MEFNPGDRVRLKTGESGVIQKVAPISGTKKWLTIKTDKGKILVVSELTVIDPELYETIENIIKEELELVSNGF